MKNKKKKQTLVFVLSLQAIWDPDVLPCIKDSQFILGTVLVFLTNKGAYFKCFSPHISVNSYFGFMIFLLVSIII